MAFKRATFTLTTSGGVATDSVKLSTPASPTRPVYLESVVLDDSAAFGTPNGLNVFEAFPDADGVITEGRQVFAMDSGSAGGVGIPTASFDAEGVAQGPTITPRTTQLVVDENGATMVEPARIDIRNEYLVVTLTGGNEGDVWTVYVFYETAGDWRF